MNPTSSLHFTPLLRATVCSAAMLILASCASTPPPPTEGLTAAHSAIGNAEKAGAARYAAPELAESQEKLAAANVAVSNKSMPSAQRLAEQSRVEADLASAKSAEAKALAANDEMKQSNTELVEEMQRKSGGQQ